MIIQIVESSAQALIEDSRATKSERAVVANGETAGVDSTRLRRGVELELVVRNNFTNTSLGISESAIAYGNNEGSGSTAGITL